jgi:NADH:ubiquinone oxidoreductase subunit C
MSSGDWVEQLSARLVGTADVEVTVFGDVAITVPRPSWTTMLGRLRDHESLQYFDWLSAVDEGESGFTVYCHLYDPTSGRRVLVRTALPAEDPSLDSATGVFRGVAWHERETAEMFGIAFNGAAYPARLLLAEEFEGHPLRKDFVLTARVSKSWPGAKEPGESGGAPSRRKMQPPGVADPAWGPRGAGATDG